MTQDTQKLVQALEVLEECRSSVVFDRTRYSQLVLSGSTHTIKTAAAQECGRLGLLLDRMEALANEPQAEPVAWAGVDPQSLRRGHFPESGKMVEQPGAVGLSEREAFEAAFIRMRPDGVLDRRPNGEYVEKAPADAWVIWQEARAALAAARPAGQCPATIAGLEAAGGHLSALVDDLRGLLAESMRVMKDLHESATPDDGPEMNAIIPAGAFRQFVDDNASLMHKIAISAHAGMLPAANRAKDKGDTNG